MSSINDKKPYRAPVLTRYGRLEAVTTGNTGPQDDGMIGAMSMKKK